MKMTRYFRATRSRPDRVIIRDEWIRYVIESPEGEHVQADGVSVGGRESTQCRVESARGPAAGSRDGTQRIF